MASETEHNSQQAQSPEQTVTADYSYVTTTGRVATYDNLMSAPRITEIQPAPTAEFIEKLTSTVYEQATLMGGTIPYTVIREVSENFIHAQFSEIIVSILDRGNTIRFADQGPGIKQKDKAQLPGFSSAKEPMKRYIRGVGSGLPIVREYLNFSHGKITIEDNMNCGAVITISLVQDKPAQPAQPAVQTLPTTLIPPLTDRERLFLTTLDAEGILGVSELSNLTNVAMSSSHNVLKKLEEAGLVETTGQKKRTLTQLGKQVVSSL